MVQAMSAVFSKAWDIYADFVNVTHNSKKWWNGSCTHALTQYQSSQLQEDWAAFQHTTHAAKRTFFD